MLASWRRIPETYRPMHSPIVGGAKINRYFYFIHILYILGCATFIIIHKNSRWAVFFRKSLFSSSRTGSFSKECTCPDARNKFIIFPVCLRVHQNILNTSPSQRKTHLRTPFFFQNSFQWLLSTEAVLGEKGNQNSWKIPMTKFIYSNLAYYKSTTLLKMNFFIGFFKDF